jgi:hypothetical protein
MDTGIYSKPPYLIEEFRTLHIIESKIGNICVTFCA